MLSPGHLLTQDDLADLVAPEIGTKLRALRQFRDDIYAPLRQLNDQQTEQRDDVQRSDLRIRAVQKPQSGVAVGSASVSVVDEQKRRDKAAAELKRIGAMIEIRSARWNAAGAVVVRVESFIRETLATGKRLVPMLDPEPKLQRGENLLTAIERFRRRLRELAAEGRRIKSAPLPSAEAKKIARAQIEALAERGRPSVSRLIEVGGAIEFAETNLRVPVIGDAPALAAWSAPDTLALAVWINQKALVAALDAEIAGEADDGAALSAAARSEQSAAVARDIAAIEADEASLVWQAWEQHLPVDARADASPAALLMAEVVAGTVTEQQAMTHPDWRAARIR